MQPTASTSAARWRDGTHACKQAWTLLQIVAPAECLRRGERCMCAETDGDILGHRAVMPQRLPVDIVEAFERSGDGCRRPERA